MKHYFEYEFCFYNIGVLHIESEIYIKVMGGKFLFGLIKYDVIDHNVILNVYEVALLNWHIHCTFSILLLWLRKRYFVCIVSIRCSHYVALLELEIKSV